MTETIDEVLAHYGVRGMKWGVRKNRDGTVKTARKTTPVSEDAAAAKVSKAKTKTGGTDALSNKELQQLVNRMNLEQQYSRLNKGNSLTNKGARLATELLLGVGKTQLLRVANDAASKQISVALNRKK